MAKDDLEKLKAAAGGDSRGSPLYRWMWKHHDEFHGIVNVPRPNWKGITAYFTDQGYRSASGGELVPNAVTKTWERVHRRHGTQAARRKSMPQPLAATPLPEIREAVPADSPRLQVRPALPLRASADPAPAGPTVDRPRETKDPDANERDIARIRDRIRAIEGKMPDPFK